MIQKRKWCLLWGRHFACISSSTSQQHEACVITTLILQLQKLRHSEIMQAQRHSWVSNLVSRPEAHIKTDCGPIKFNLLKTGIF